MADETFLPSFGADSRDDNNWSTWHMNLTFHINSFKSKTQEKVQLFHTRTALEFLADQFQKYPVPEANKAKRSFLSCIQVKRQFEINLEWDFFVNFSKNACDQKICYNWFFIFKHKCVYSEDYVEYLHEAMYKKTFKFCFIGDSHRNVRLFILLNWKKKLLFTLNEEKNSKRKATHLNCSCQKT